MISTQVAKTYRLNYLQEQLGLFQLLGFPILSGFVVPEPLGLDRLNNFILGKLDHHKLVQLLQILDVRFVDRPFVVDVRQKCAGLFVRQLVQGIVPVGGLDQVILHPTCVRCIIQQLPEVLARFAADRGTVGQSKYALMLAAESDQIVHAWRWTALSNGSSGNGSSIVRT